MHIAAFIEFLLSKKYTGNYAFYVGCYYGKVILFLMKPFWRIKISGLKDLKKIKSPMVIVCNHQSMVDLHLVNYLGVPFKAIGKNEAFQIPLYGSCLKVMRFIPVKRNDKDSRHNAYEKASQLIEEGLTMFLFAEGTRSKDGQFLPFKMGAFNLAEKHKVPLVPLVIKGAIDLMQPKSLIPKCGQATLQVLPVMKIEPNETAEIFSERVKKAMLEKYLA
jgi:1-acyl-sn-glycerol-3-phosphate acyltransferase